MFGNSDSTNSISKKWRFIVDFFFAVVRLRQCPSANKLLWCCWYVNNTDEHWGSFSLQSGSRLLFVPPYSVYVMRDFWINRAETWVRYYGSVLRQSNFRKKKKVILKSELTAITFTGTQQRISLKCNSLCSLSLCVIKVNWHGQIW